MSRSGPLSPNPCRLSVFKSLNILAYRMHYPLLGFTRDLEDTAECEDTCLPPWEGHFARILSMAGMAGEDGGGLARVLHIEKGARISQWWRAQRLLPPTLHQL